jgi:hypothetical protein
MAKVMRPGRLAGQAKTLLRCGMLAGPVFTATFLAEGAVRDGYQPMRLPVSSLALGPGSYGGLFQRASIITGLGWLTAVSARGLQRHARY